MANGKKPVPYFDTAAPRPESILTNSKIALATVFSDKKIEFSRQDFPDKVIFELRGTGTSSYQLEEFRYILYPIKIDKATFLLNLGIKFARISQKSFLFSGVSLKIFKLVSEKIIGLFRAEWDAVNEEDIHAQPHWHVQLFDSNRDDKKIASAEEFKGEKLQIFAELEETQKPIIEDLDCFSRFHYAMSADWHNTGKHSIRIKDEKLLANWLQGCLKYTIGQLQYVINHSPSS